MHRDFKARLGISIAMAVAPLLIIAGVIVYLGFDIAKKSEAIFSTQSEFTTRSRAISSLADLRREAEMAAPLFEKLRNALPSEDNLLDVRSALEALAKQQGLGFSSKFGIEAAGTGNTPDRVKLEIAAQGRYNDIVRFITETEQTSYFINFITTDLVRQGARFNGTLNAEVLFSK